MALGSKFAHLWLDEASQSSPSSESSEDTKVESLKVTMDFLTSLDQGSLDYLERDCDKSDLFASFGYDTTLGTFPQVGVSPGRAENNSNVAGGSFMRSSSSSWPSENVSGGSPASFRNISDGVVNGCSTMSFANSRLSNMSPSYTSPRKSDGDSLVGFGCSQLPSNGNYGSCSLTGLDAPLLTSSPLPSSVDIDSSSSVFNTRSQLGYQGKTNYSALTQTLTYIAGQLADLGFGSSQEDVSSPNSPWGNRVKGFGNVGSESIQKWIKLLRNIQDTLMDASDMDGIERSQMLELSCTLQKQLLYHIVGDEASKVPGGFGSQDLSNESQSQAAKFLREHGGFVPPQPCLWRGVLPRRDYQNATFSCKVFLGGLPYDMTAAGIMQAFSHFGTVKVEWPGILSNPLQHKGFAYIIFENETQVKYMLSHCTVDYAQDGKWFCPMTSRRVRAKDVEVIPWALSDSNFALRPSSKLEPRLTIFVGALHGMLNAEGLAVVMENLFHGVVHAGIDTDRSRYPIGSGRVSFDNFHSYFTAINAGFVEIKSTKFSKVVQVDPYLEDSNCSHCSLQQAPYFCRNLNCFRYYCRTCFELAHATEALRTHRPLMRNPNKKTQSTGYSSSSTSFNVNYRS